MDATTTRERLLQAAAEVFLAQGFGESSMDLVRQRAGASNGSLYHHFPTKASLADALYAQTLREFHAAVMVPIRGRASARSGVKGLVRAYVERVIAHPGQARLLHELRRTGQLEGGAGEWERANAQGFGLLRAWVDRKVDAGELRPLPFPVWIAMVFGPLLQLTPAWLAAGTPQVPPKVRQALEQAVWCAVAPPGEGR